MIRHSVPLITKIANRDYTIHKKNEQEIKGVAKMTLISPCSSHQDITDSDTRVTRLMKKSSH